MGPFRYWFCHVHLCVCVCVCVCVCICMYVYNMCVYMCVCVFGRTCVCVLFLKNFNLGHYMQSVLPVFFFHTYHAYRYLTSTILYHLHWPWSCQGHKVSTKLNLLASFFRTLFHLIRMKFDVVMKHFKLDILWLLLSMVYWNEGNKSCFPDCAKNLLLGCIQMNWFDSMVWWYILMYSTLWY